MITSLVSKLRSRILGIRVLLQGNSASDADMRSVSGLDRMASLLLENPVIWLPLTGDST